MIKRKLIYTFICVLLTLSLVTTVFFIPVHAANNTAFNFSKYHLANWYGLDELPFGDDSGVVYLRTYNGQKWVDLTICFNKCTPLYDFNGKVSTADYDGNSIIKNFTLSHLWGLKTGDKAHGNSFYFSCVSDSPIYYTYGNVGENWNTVPWSYVSQRVKLVQPEEPDTATSTPVYRTVYVYLDVSLGSLGFNVGSEQTWWVYSNKVMINNLSGNYEKDCLELHAITFNTPKDSEYSGCSNYNLAKTDVLDYAFACYPSSACLRDWQLFSLESQYFDSFNYLFMDISDTLLYISDNTAEILECMKTIATGGEPYPNGGLLNDSTYSDSIDSAMGSISTDTSAANYIKSLSASFMVIKGLWDKIVNIFGLYPVIGLLLFLAFTAYLLGRALKGRFE